MELSGPGVQYIADNQLYNSIITAHAILMIFFMVEKLLPGAVRLGAPFGRDIFNFILRYSFYCTYYSATCGSVDKDSKDKIFNNNCVLTVGNSNNNDNDDKDPKDSKYKYVKILVNDPYNNRDLILKVTKKQKGIYV